MSFLPSKIISGGQTGVDRAALDFAIKHCIPYRGFVPKARWAEDGRISDRYENLIEADSSDPAERTRLNVMSTAVVLLVSHGDPDGGSKLTIALARQHCKPLLHIDLNQISLFLNDLFQACADLARCNETMIAGPRESKCPGIYVEALEFLERLYGA